MDVPALLDGVTVVELGDGIAGSVAAATFAALGATVCKGVDADRPHLRHRPAVDATDRSAITQTLDVHKTVVTTSTARQLARSADVVIVDAIDSLHDRIESTGVVATISAFGLDGPRSGDLGGELVSAAAGGLLGTIVPEGGGRPVSPPGFVAMRAVGAVAALAALHGLDERGRTTTPVHVDVSAQEALVFTAALPECAHVLFECPGQAGSGRYVAPSGVFPCADGSIRITAVENHQWSAMVVALGTPAWTAGLEDRPARAEHADLIVERVGEWTATQAKAACAALLQEHGVPAAAVNLPGELLESPQFEHRSSIEQVALAGTSATMLGSPWRLQLSSETADRRPGVRRLRVVELTHVLAGPIVGALLGGMGATVLRVEDRDRLDIYRRTGPFASGVAGEEQGAYFHVANHSKRSVAAQGEELLALTGALLGSCDVLIENVGSSRLDRLGVDPTEVADRGVLSLRLSGFGADGPMASYKVYANTVQAYGGLAWMTRDHDDEPATFGSVLADPLSSVISASVIAAWALGAERCHGGVVDLAMVEVVAGCIGEYVAAASTGVEIEPPVGNDLEPFAPHGVYRTADDRWVALAVQSDDEWTALVQALGAPVELDRPTWRDTADRWADRHAIDEVVAHLVADRSATELVTTVTASGVRAATVATGADLVVDEHLAERRYFATVEHPELGRVRVLGLPWRFAGEGPIPIAAAPVLGSTTIDEALEVLRGT